MKEAKFVVYCIDFFLENIRCNMYSTPKRKPLKLEKLGAGSKTLKRQILCKVSCTTALYLVSFTSCTKPHFFTTSHAHAQTLSYSTLLPLSPYSVVASDRNCISV
jgi:hypothetical protein